MRNWLLIALSIALAVSTSSLIYEAAAKSEGAPVLRASAIELVDSTGQVRAQLDMQDESVVLRLRDADGQIRVKLAASKDGSGLLLLNESTEPGVHMLAQQESSIALRQGDETKQLRP